MKIFCVGRNYALHAKELGNAIPENPVIFMKPPTALLKDNKPFYLPEFSNQMEYEAEVVLRVGKNGKHIAEKFAKNYISHIALGIDFTARDVQNQLKEKKLPWELAKAFDHSAVLGNMIEYETLADKENVLFSLKKNKETVQTGNTADMLFSFDKLISYISTYFTLQTGDLIYTGTPEGVGSVKVGDVLNGYLMNEGNFQVEIK